MWQESPNEFPDAAVQVRESLGIHFVDNSVADDLGKPPNLGEKGFSVRVVTDPREKCCQSLPVVGVFLQPHLHCLG
jgi:hypothetical protein